MNMPEINTSLCQTKCLSSVRTLKINGYNAIQSFSAAEVGVGSLLVKDNVLLVVLHGCLRIRYGTTAYTIAKDHMALLRKDILIEFSEASQPGRPDTIDYMMIYIREDILKEFVKLTRLSVPPPAQPTAVTMDSLDIRLLKVIDSLESYFSEAGSIDEYLTRIKLLELLFNLLQAESIVLPQLMDLRTHFRADITSTVEEHVMSAMSLSQLAELSGRSLSSFKRDFFAIYNMPPSTWVRLRRLEKARELFLNTTMTVTDVCYTLGFENLAHFSRVFKSHFGYPPSKARKTTLKVA